MYLSDCHMTFFFNDPSRIALSEMIGNMPCCELLFEAETDAEYQHLVSLNPQGVCTPALLELRTWICQDLWGGLQGSQFDSISVPHLLLLICCEYPTAQHYRPTLTFLAFDSMYFSSRMSFAANSVSEEILRATNR